MPTKNSSSSLVLAIVILLVFSMGSINVLAASMSEQNDALDIGYKNIFPGFSHFDSQRSGINFDLINNAGAVDASPALSIGQSQRLFDENLPDQNHKDWTITPLAVVFIPGKQFPSLFDFANDGYHQAPDAVYYGISNATSHDTKMFIPANTSVVLVKLRVTGTGDPSSKIGCLDHSYVIMSNLAGFSSPVIAYSTASFSDEYNLLYSECMLNTGWVVFYMPGFSEPDRLLMHVKLNAESFAAWMIKE